MSVVHENEIIEKRKIVTAHGKNFVDSVDEFIYYTEQISEVIEGLQVYFNTTGGKKMITNLSNVDFNIEFLKNIANQVNDVEIQYQKEKKII